MRRYRRTQSLHFMCVINHCDIHMRPIIGENIDNTELQPYIARSRRHWYHTDVEESLLNVAIGIVPVPSSVSMTLAVIGLMRNLVPRVYSRVASNGPHGVSSQRSPSVSEVKLKMTPKPFVIGRLGESTCDRWIPLRNNQYRGKFFYVITSSGNEHNHYEWKKLWLSYFNIISMVLRSRCLIK